MSISLTVIAMVAQRPKKEENALPAVITQSSTAPSYPPKRDLIPISNPAERATLEIHDEGLSIPQSIDQEVPFTPQAPLGEWSDALQQDGCEESSVLMAMLWARNQKLENSQEYKDAILAISQWEQIEYGIAKDTSAKDTVERIFKGYFKHTKVETKTITKYQEIVEVLSKGSLVIIPANGQIIGSPYYTPPGPERHMIVIKGYDQKTSEFITNDPGTRHGKGYRYNFQQLYNAIRDYPTGDHEPINENNKLIIEVKKDSNFPKN